MNTSQRAGAPSGPPGTTPATPTTRSRKSAVLGVLVILIILALGVGLALWQNRTMPSTVRSVSLAASATAQAASAPAASASAPAAAASAADQTAVALAAADQALAAAQVQPVQAADATAEPVEHDVESGQTLGDVTKLRKDLKGQWRALCYENRKVLKYGCHDIRPGMVLQLVISEETKAAMPRAPRAMFEHGLRRPRVRPLAAATPRAAAPTTRAGIRLYEEVGRAPLRDCGRMSPVESSERAWVRAGLSEEDKAYLRARIDPKGPRRNITVTEGLYFIPKGVVLPFVTFCRGGDVVAVGPMLTAWKDGKSVPSERFVLPSGKAMAWMWECNNWVPVPAPEKELPPPPPVARTTPTDPTPPVDPTPSPTPPLPPTATPKPDKGLCERVEPEAALGQHHVPPQNGDRARSDFLAFLVDCQRRLASDDGSWGVGVKGNASQWKGTANRGAGGYRGYQWLAQGSYREILDEGRNWNVGAGVGRQRESYREGAYASETTYHLVGVTAAYNDYRRRMAGETWNVEQQYFAGITVPTAAHMSQTWFGQPTDASGMPRLKVGVQAGGRWWIHETEDSVVLPYVEAGLFVQHPTSASGNVLVGIADRNRVCGIGIGVDKDLQNSGDAVGAWGWNCDLFQGGRVVRAKARERQIVVDNEARGVRFDRASGVMYVTDPAKFGAIAAPTE